MKNLVAVLVLGSLFTLLCLSAPPAQAQDRHSGPTVNIQLPGAHPSYGPPPRVGHDEWRARAERERWERIRLERERQERLRRERWERERRHHGGGYWNR